MINYLMLAGDAQVSPRETLLSMKQGQSSHRILQLFALYQEASDLYKSRIHAHHLHFQSVVTAPSLTTPLALVEQPRQYTPIAQGHPIEQAPHHGQAGQAQQGCGVAPLQVYACEAHAAETTSACSKQYSFDTCC